MREKQLIQLLQFVLLWILLGLFVVFVKEESFVDFVLRYRLYLLIVSLSYFYYYSIQYELDKKHELIRNTLICGNVYLFLHIFFRPLLNISHQLFLLLGLIFLGLWWCSKLKTRWKYLLQVVGGVFTFFILISGMFYLYPEAPDIDGFIKNRTTKILFLGLSKNVDKKDAYIQIINQKGTTDLGILPYFSRNLSENQKILYPSVEKQRDEKIIIETQNGDLVRIFPQSEIQLEFTGDKLKKISKLNGRIGFLSGVFSSNIEVSGYEQNLTLEQNLWLKGIQDVYKSELLFYLKNQISESNIGWANNTIMYDIDGRIIGFLARMFPITFGKNLRNYKKFQKYFGWSDEGLDLSKYSVSELEKSGGEQSSLWSYIKDNMDIGKNNMYGWFKKPEKR